MTERLTELLYTKEYFKKEIIGKQTLEIIIKNFGQYKKF